MALLNPNFRKPAFQPLVDISKLGLSAAIAKAGSHCLKDRFNDNQLTCPNQLHCTKDLPIGSLSPELVKLNMDKP